MQKRRSTNPKRRIVAEGTLSNSALRKIRERAIYVGSAHHKRSPGDYGFQPPVNPRPSKSLCDDVKLIRKADAQRLLQEGIRKGIISEPGSDGLPKYVWSVDLDQEVYEAKLGSSSEYHGYRLDRADERYMRDLVLKEWSKR